MTQALIAPDGPEWPQLSHLPAQVAAWEASVRRSLPPVYRAFLLAYNGGRIFPSLFDVRQPAEVWGMSDFATFADPLYGFDYAISLWNGDTYFDATPKDMFFIGCNPGGVEILLSLRSHDHGRIYTWWGGMTPWGEPGNDDQNIYLQANDFAEFIGQMYETPDGQARAYWTSPRHEMLAQPLKVG